MTDREPRARSALARAARRDGASPPPSRAPAGCIAGAITDVAGSSAWFDRGFVTYSNEAKIEMLGVRAGDARGARRGQRGDRARDGRGRAGAQRAPSSRSRSPASPGRPGGIARQAGRDWSASRGRGATAGRSRDAAFRRRPRSGARGDGRRRPGRADRPAGAAELRRGSGRSPPGAGPAAARRGRQSDRPD